MYPTVVCRRRYSGRDSKSTASFRKRGLLQIAQTSHPAQKSQRPKGKIMKGIIFPGTFDESTIRKHWATHLVSIVEKAIGKKALQLSTEEKVAIALVSGMEPVVVDDHIIGSVRVGPMYAFEVIDGKDGKWSVVSCAPLKNR